MHHVFFEALWHRNGPLLHGSPFGQTRRSPLHSHPLDSPGLLFFGAVAVLALGFLLFRGRGEPRMRRLALLLVTAGAIGNYLDRVVRGYVVDFVHIHHWPVFNVADAYVTVGYVLLAWTFFGHRRRVGPAIERAQP